jgi:signal transduction histidine kinase
VKNEVAAIPENTDTSFALTKLYTLALSVIALLSIAGQFLIQKSLREETKDSYIVNMAGRQRMLSQKICKITLLLESDKHQNKKAYLKDLRESFETWKKFHNGLYHGDLSIGLDNSFNSPRIIQLFAGIDPYFKIMADNTTFILNAYSNDERKTPIAEPVKNILGVEAEFLKRMTVIVHQYEVEDLEKNSSLMNVELTLLVCTLLVLLLEGLFIFRPAARRIRESFLALIVSENKTRVANINLKATQKALEKMNNELETKIRERTREIEGKNKELEEKNQQFARVNRDLDNFVYTASHDLKAPISNIEGLMEVMTPEIYTKTDTMENLISMIKESVAKFRTVLKELSDTGKAKVEASGKTFPVSFKEVLEEIEISIKGMIDSSGAIITEDFSEAPAINFSKKNLRSIVYNLISNAIKYKSPERNPVINIFSEKKDNYIVLAVKDNGMGMKEEDIPKLFSMYTRLTDKVEGTGVGLAMVKRIIENNGGRIEVKSKAGEGSTFFVFFKG